MTMERLLRSVDGRPHVILGLLLLLLLLFSSRLASALGVSTAALVVFLVVFTLYGVVVVVGLRRGTVPQ